MLGLALALAVLIGVSLGLLGSGGSIITLPVLVYAARIPVAQAVGMSLVIVGATSAAGSYLRYREKAVAGKPAIFFSVSGMVGAFFGARLTHLVAPTVLLLIFGLLMLTVGSAMLRGRGGESVRQSCHPVKCLGVGLAVGVLTGFLGVGGGFLILPALVLFAGVEMKKAIGTSLAIIAFNSFAGLAGQLRYVRFDWGLTLVFLVAALGGMFGGLALANRLSAQSLRRSLGWAIIGLGAFLTVKNLLNALAPS
jgi:uncharacterized membrane protein YfcA